MLGLLLAVILALSPLSQAAAEPVLLPTPVGDGGRAYVDALRGSGVVAGVSYYDPGHPAPALQTDVEVAPPQPAPAREAGGGLDIGRWLVGGIFAAVLAVVLLLAARFGGVHAVSFARLPEGGARGARSAPAGAAGPEDQGPDSLDEIGRIADRRQALHLLLQRSLQRAAAANGRHPGRGQTVRDILRSLPASWPQLPALATIAAHAEVVEFGGRELTEATFRTCLDAARPVFAAASPPAGGR